VFGVREIVLSAVLIGAAAAAVCNEPSLGRKRRFVSWSGRAQPATIRTFHHWLRAQRFGWPATTRRVRREGYRKRQMY